MSNPFHLQAVTRNTAGIATPPFADAPRPVRDQATEWQFNQQFIAMLNAYRGSGGLARAQEVATRFKLHGRTAVNNLADWILKRHVISLEWADKIWLPWCQFNPDTMTLLPGLSEALSELVTVYDDWEVAHWFSQPNPWLADGSPADRLALAAPEVLNAARAERFMTVR
ncbi:MAG: hypothetical protein JZU64_04545 [Rhodoferax sp.]|jgi:hypothetical protein|nr:hypothetical protein [Rhodoferax sp.]